MQGKPVGESILQGEGAGPGPTSSSLFSDLLTIMKGNVNKPFGIPSNKRKKESVIRLKISIAPPNPPIKNVLPRADNLEYFFEK